MYMIIGADIVPTKSNKNMFIKGDVNGLVGDDIERLLIKADYRIFNLETPLTDFENPITKQGPNLSAGENTVKGIQALGVDLLSLANNHIFDHEKEGLLRTIETLDKAGISYVGAGENLSIASKPFCFRFSDKKVGVYACTEHEFSIAEKDKAGANPFDPLWSFDHISELKQKVDFVIVLYHGGKEHYRYPSPNLQKICRRMIDKGADLVLCQHSHCIGCEEKYSGRTILYGQGNFIFDYNDDICWQTSLLVRVDDNLTISYIPILKQSNGVVLAKYEIGECIINDFANRSEKIKNSAFIQQKYDELADENIYKYLKVIQGKKTFIHKIANKITGNILEKLSLRYKYDLKHLAAIQNWIDCEAHHELLLRGIERLENNGTKQN